MRRLHQTATQKIDKQNLCLFPPHQCESCRLFNRTKPNKRHLIVWRILSLENRCIRWKKPYQTIKRRAFASQQILVTPTAALFFCSVIWAEGTCLNDRWRVIYGTARRRHPLHVGVWFAPIIASPCSYLPKTRAQSPVNQALWRFPKRLSVTMSVVQKVIFINIFASIDLPTHRRQNLLFSPRLPYIYCADPPDGTLTSPVKGASNQGP